MPGGSFSPRRIIEAIERDDTQFGGRVADNTQNRLDIPGTYRYNTERHRVNVNGSFIQDLANTTKFTDQAATYQLEPEPGDTVEFRVREKLRYVPNYELLWGAATWYDSTPSAGQKLFVEFTDDARENGYRYAFEPGNTRCEQLRSGTVVSTLPQSEWGAFPEATQADHDPLSVEGFDRTSPMNPRAMVGWYGALGCRYELSYTHPESAGPRTPTLGYTAVSDGVATDEIVCNMKVVAECDSGAEAFTAQACSFGALIRGNATPIDRAKNGPFWNLGGAISQHFSDNDPVLAARIDPNRDNVVVEIQTPEINPAGTDVIEVLVGAVQPGDTDANFDDPDNDGTEEGPSPRAQVKAQNDVLQWTRSVSTFPTVTDIRADGTEGLVPDIRYLTGAVGEGGGNNRAAAPQIDNVRQKKTLYPDEVLLFIPRTDPGGNVTDGTIQYIRPHSEQDW